MHPINPTFVALEMAEADVAYPRGVDDLRDGFLYLGKHPPEAGVKQQGLVVADEEMVELQVDLRRIDGDPKDIGCNLSDDGHSPPSGDYGPVGS
jgi:hypothetical protein